MDRVLRLMKAGDFQEDAPFAQAYPVPSPPEHRNVTSCNIVGDVDDGATKKWTAGAGVSEEYVKCYRGGQREPCIGEHSA